MTAVQMALTISVVCWLMAVPPKKRGWLLVPAIIFGAIAIAKQEGWLP